MISKYFKEADYSYALGFFPTFELLKNHPESLLYVYCSPEAKNSEGLEKLKGLLGADKLVESVNAFKKLSEKENDHVIGVFRKYEERLNKDADHVVLVNPSDMGNLGNIMRSMLAFGFKDLAIILPAADRFNPKTIRSSMGAFFSIRQETFSSFDDYLKAYPRPYYPFMLNERACGLNSVQAPKGKYALVFGNEATGLPQEIGNGNTVFIEQSKDVDSLNLATAAVLGLYKFRSFKE